jgi:hypothetical protein
MGYDYNYVDRRDLVPDQPYYSETLYEYGSWFTPISLFLILIVILDDSGTLETTLMQQIHSLVGLPSGIYLGISPE